MSKEGLQDEVDRSAEFERQAEESQPGLLTEFVYFLRYNKKWWLVPILVTLAFLGDQTADRTPGDLPCRRR